MKDLILAILLTFSVFYVTAQDSDSIRSSELVFDLPVIDLPYQVDAAKTVNGGVASFGGFFKGYVNPGMDLSLNLSADLYTGLHFGIKKLFHLNSQYEIRDWSTGKRLLYLFTLCGSDLISVYAPGFDGWEHEEYHRAVMSRFQVNSFDDMNKFPLGSELISVSHVSDEDLVRFKKASPADYIRMHSAGIEGEYLLIDKLQRNNFFYKQDLPHEFIYIFSTLNAISYVKVCSDPSQVDPLTDEMNAKENNIPVRDFTGMDFTAWTYDLFRPGEPYTDRGTHPSGNGINRYIKTTDLTEEELSYLKKQGNLQWLNAISPMLIGVRRIKLSENGLYGNFAVRDILTSFGNDISGTVLLMDQDFKLSFTLHSYQNHHHSFPAVETQLLEHEATIASQVFLISPRILLGMQPLDQGFLTGENAFLGFAECKLELISKTVVHPYIELSVKSNGWVAGNEFLDANLSFRVGIISRFVK